eukprot:COSAG06_NODE_6884_length_2730_cov_1.062334_3_plen_74_part_00
MTHRDHNQHTRCEVARTMKWKRFHKAKLSLRARTTRAPPPPTAPAAEGSRVGGVPHHLSSIPGSVLQAGARLL